jgi:hypothetical protein
MRASPTQRACTAERGVFYASFIAHADEVRAVVSQWINPQSCSTKPDAARLQRVPPADLEVLRA